MGKKFMVNIRSTTAVYVQIENIFKFAIASGELKTGDQLPSVRELSEQTNVNQNTVAKAYRDLEVMGLLYTRRGVGVYVAQGATEKCQQLVNSKIISRLFEVVSEAGAAGFPKAIVDEVVKKSMAAKSNPYGELPPEIQAIIKNK